MSTTMAIDADVEGLLREVFSAERTSDGLWSLLVETGLAELGTPVALGGGGASFAEVTALLRAAGYGACSLPLAEHDLVSGRLLARSGDGRLRTVARVDDRGVAPFVPMTDEVEVVVVVRSTPDGGTQVGEIGAGDGQWTDAIDVVGQARPTLTLPEQWTGWSTAASADLGRAARLLLAWARAAAACGAMDRVLELCVEHATSRTQFGRPIGRFQAVQSLVADIAAEAAVSRASVEAAALRIGEADGSALAAATIDAEFEIAAACSVVGHAGSIVVRNAHQVVGALGTTREHLLHQYTRRILAWRSEFGSVRDWDLLVFEQARTAGGAWRRISPPDARSVGFDRTGPGPGTGIRSACVVETQPAPRPGHRVDDAAAR